jgi:cyclopropane fatty-acyl-phospholipid synthase-like methyltransferase
MNAADPRDYYAIIERDHQIQNPTSAVKLSRLVDYLTIEDGHRILDVGCGKAGLLRAIARKKTVQALGLEVNAVFAAEARTAIEQAGLQGNIDIREGPALSYEDRSTVFDVTLCIGASFAIGSFEAALDWLNARTKPGAGWQSENPTRWESRSRQRIVRDTPASNGPFRKPLTFSRPEISS